MASNGQPASSPPAPAQDDKPIDSTTDLDVDVDMDLDGEVEPKATEEPQAATTLEEDFVEPREPTKKDIALGDFIAKMDDYAPIIPDAVTGHHLLLAGLDPATTPLPIQRLLALATQKFIADVAADAYQYSRMRSSNSATTGASASAMAAAGNPGDAAGGGKPSGGKEDKGKGGMGHILGVQRAGYGGGGGGGGGASSGRAVLTMEDLGCAVGEYGVNIKRGEFYR